MPTGQESISRVTQMAAESFPVVVEPRTLVSCLTSTRVCSSSVAGGHTRFLETAHSSFLCGFQQCDLLLHQAKKPRLVLALTCKELGSCHFHPFNEIGETKPTENTMAFLRPIRELRSLGNYHTKYWRDGWIPRVTAAICLLGAESTRAINL